MGIGRAGGALALAFARAGLFVDLLIHRDPAIAERLGIRAKLVSADAIPDIDSDVIVIATGDPDIETAARILTRRVSRTPVVLHTSGSLSSAVLHDLAKIGCPTGSMHPLVSISDPATGADNIRGAFFCIEGDERATRVATTLVEALGGRPFSIPTEFKPLYHAAAVTACGHLVALIDVAIEMLTRCGVDRPKAQEVLLPLIHSTIVNLAAGSPATALTGSFARADVMAFERHLDSIDREMSGEVRDIYLLLAERSTDLAEANGVDLAAIGRMRDRIRVAKRKSWC